jgi:molecular chaperone GrpE (heat shock protein)
MSAKDAPPRKPPKPRLPSRARAAVKGAVAPPGERRTRVTTSDLADRLDRLAQMVEALEAALAPRERSKDVAAEEHALLNLVDSIVDRRTERVLLPLAHLATLLDRLVVSTDADDAKDLILESGARLAVVLEALGLERIEPARGDESDPWLHEEVGVVTDSDLDEGLIERVVRPGIRIRGGRTLVPALVAVAGGTGQGAT